MITLAQTDTEILQCFDVLQQLRPHLQRETYLPFVRTMMAEGFQLAYLTDDEGAVECVAGFKISHNFYLGKRLYVEDLITADTQRGSGCGGKMFDWLKQHARENACSALHLDSGVQRFRAHKFYLMQDMQIVCHHFALTLD